MVDIVEGYSFLFNFHLFYYLSEWTLFVFVIWVTLCVYVCVAFYIFNLLSLKFIYDSDTSS